MSTRDNIGHSNVTACIVLALVAWIGNGLYAFGDSGGALKYWSSALVAGAMIGFLIVHGRIIYTQRQLLGFTVAVFAVGWMFETLSVISGFPFGNYHYTDAMAPFLGNVSVYVLPAYWVMGYVSWSMSRILLNRLDAEVDATLQFGAPVLASGLMVLWDLSMDPLRATVEQRWIWQDGGPHLGVPIANYFGWAFVTWVMFQSFAILLTFWGRNTATPAPAVARRYWLSVPLIYVAFAVEYLVNPIAAAGSQATVAVNGIPTPVIGIFTVVAQLTAVTMIPVALLAAFLVMKSEARERQGRAEVQMAAINDGMR
jgi:putative membrane protein